MHLGRIRLTAAILTISFTMMMASASEAQAAMYRPNIYCHSGRCIRASGIAVASCKGVPEDYGAAAFMLDLREMYIVVDTTFGFSADLPVYNIDYLRFRIYEAHDGGGANIIIGIPGGAHAWFHTGGPCGVDLYGFASFYYRMDSLGGF